MNLGAPFMRGFILCAMSGITTSPIRHTGIFQTNDSANDPEPNRPETSHVLILAEAKEVHSPARTSVEYPATAHAPKSLGPSQGCPFRPDTPHSSYSAADC